MQSRKKMMIILTFVSTIVIGMPLTGAILPEYRGQMRMMPPLPGYCDNDAELKPQISLPVVKENNQQIAPAFQHIDEDIVSLIQRLTADMTIGYITNLTSFGPRATTTDACVNAGAYIYQEFKNMGLEVRYHNWTESDTLYGSNIEATLPGLDTDSDEIYIVCGHYDSVSSSPGADDNAAGTSVVLSAAEIMSKHHFNHTVKFVAFSGEEQGLKGSKHYAFEAYEQNKNIVAVLNADMMGYADSKEAEQFVVVFDNDESSWITDYTIDISNEYEDVIHLDVVRGGTSGRSDHASFHWTEFNAIFYFEYERNPHYHGAHDTLDTMNPFYATNVSRLALATLMSLSELTINHPPETPSRPTGEQSGTTDTSYIYRTTTMDMEDDEIWYLWDWGDESTSEWVGPFDSGSPCEISHEWNDDGQYQIRVKAKDSHDEESNWSDPLSVTMPKTKKGVDLFEMISKHALFNKVFTRFFHLNIFT